MIKERRYYFRKSVDSESVLCYNKARVKRQIMFPIYIYPPVAKLDIAADSDSEGRGFESLRAGHDGVTKKMSLHFFSIHAGLRAFGSEIRKTVLP
jgi:hypothetical protein